MGIPNPLLSYLYVIWYTGGSQAFQTTGQKQYLGKFVGPLWKKIFKAVETSFYAH